MPFSVEILIAALAGFLLDLLLGDPAWMPHPVVAMGKAISLMENWFRKWFPKTDKGERAAGTLMGILLPLLTLVCSGLIIWAFGLIDPKFRLIPEIIWSWQVLAMRDLRKESRNVKEKLETEPLEEARKAVGRIVGRDTEQLNEEQVAKAAIESVAESFSDGEVAPLFYLLIGGAPLALCYKAINTMDSMVGYKNDRYLNYGRFAAKLDDVANYLPSRIAALLLILAAFLLGENGAQAYSIWKRDRRNHASPNSAQTESAMAGALGLQLNGPAYYFGKLVDKPTVGDPLQPATPKDIDRANCMMYAGAFLAFLLFAGLRLVGTILL